MDLSRFDLLPTVRALLAASAGLALFFLVYALASAGGAPSSPLGMRGLARKRALEESGAWASFEPLVRWLGVRLSGFLGPATREALDEQITLAGDYLGLTAEEYVALMVLSCVAGTAGGAAFGLALGGSVVLLTVTGGVLGALVPYLQVSGAAQTRLKEIGRGLPYAIDLMSLSMSAGLDFPGAVRQVVEKSSNPKDPLVVEFTRLLRELGLGKTRRQCLQDLAKRAPATAVIEFVSAVVQAEERGNPVVDVLQIQAQMSRMRRSASAEEAASKAAVKMLGPLMMAFLCAMILVLGPMLLKLSEAE